MFTLASPTPRPQPTMLIASVVALSGCSSEEERSVRGGQVEMAEFSTRTINISTIAAMSEARTARAVKTNMVGTGTDCAKREIDS